MGNIRVGTCSWADKTMIEAWYPAGLKNAADRLGYYAAHFDTAEMDSSFYGLPSERNARLWVERTPAGFVFHVKAFAMMTRHAVRPQQLPAALRESHELELDRYGRVKHPQGALRQAVFDWFSSALAPLREAGKLGVVLLQFPPYFVANEQNRDYLLWAAEMLRPDPVAIEFRHVSWVEPDEWPRTLDLLADHGLSYVGVDVPRVEAKNALPPLTAATAPLGYVRLSGRNAKTWNARVSSAAERFKYLYAEEELQEWVQPLQKLAEETETTYAMFNNCYRDYAPRNADQLKALLAASA